MKSKKVLIIEDDAPLLMALESKLTNKKFKILKAVNGEEGLKIAISKKPDLILLDIVMPKMDGLTMLTKLRGDKWGKDAQVVLLTNLSDSEKVAEALEKGVHDYLVKSDWKLEDVEKIVNEKLGI